MTTYNVLVTSAATQLCVVPPGNATVDINNNTVPGGSTPSATVYLGISNAVTATSPNIPLPAGGEYSASNFATLTTLPTFWATCPSGQTCTLSVSVNLS